MGVLKRPLRSTISNYLDTQPPLFIHSETNSPPPRSYGGICVNERLFYYSREETPIINGNNEPTRFIS